MNLKDYPLLGDDPLWFQDAVIYELHVRAFADSNGDGIGDFPGLLGKLDYLQNLGVSALWLLPFYPSPLKDDGYDIADYTSINPIYGTLADFDAVLEEAHKRGMRVITELVINHTSDQHPWFQRARKAPPGSVERDFYVWSDDPDKYRGVRIIFKDFETSNWTRDPVAGSWYWHRFYSHQPDLNYDNPAVHEAILAALDFWLDRGVDAFRLDAIPYLYEREGTSCDNLPETHAFLKKLRRHIDQRSPGRMLLAEANLWPEDAVSYFGEGDECHMNFHFPLMPRLFLALRTEDRFPIVDILQQTPSLPEGCQWALFLRNHDELTLEMVTDEDRDVMVRLYAGDPQARINLGIRRRLAPLLENHRGKIELLNALLLSLPGTPVLYYGDEIGMGDNIYLGDRNGVRTPMQWSSDRNAGFSRANPQRLYLPVVIDPSFHYESVNVEAQQQNSYSLLWWTKRMLAVRRRHQAFGRGTLDLRPVDNPRVLAFVRSYDHERLLVIANLSRNVQYAEIDLSPYEGSAPFELLGHTALPPIGAKPYAITLGAYGFYWLRLEATNVPGPEEMPHFVTRNDWTEVFARPLRDDFFDCLADFIRRQSWLRDATRTIESVSLVDVVNLAAGQGGASTRLTVIQVMYGSGEPELYALPLAFGSEGPVGKIVCRLRLGETEGVLYDPVGEKAFLDLLWPPESGAGREALAFESPRRRDEPTSTELRWPEGASLSVVRWLEEGMHPEPELLALLRQSPLRDQVAEPVATHRWRSTNGEATWAIVKRVPTHRGSFWETTRDELERFYERDLAYQGVASTPGMHEYVTALVQASQGDPSPLADELLGPKLQWVRRLGEVVGAFHCALCGVDDFAPEPHLLHVQRAMYQWYRTRLRRGSVMLREVGVEGPTSELVARARAREEDLLRQGRRIYEQGIAAYRSRLHGDLHLERVLFTGADFVLHELGGNETLHLPDRRRKRTPIRDLASLICSFGRAAWLEASVVREEDRQEARHWERFWLLWVSATFLRAWREATNGAPFAPTTTEELHLLLRFELLRRSAYELQRDLICQPTHLEFSLRQLLSWSDTNEIL